MTDRDNAVMAEEGLRTAMERFPASYAQARMWLLSQMAPESPAYTVPLVLRFTGALSVPALEASLADVLLRHDVLRTTLSSIDGEIVQLVHPAAPMRLTVRTVPAASAEATFSAEAARPFDLAVDRPVRVRLLRVEGEEDEQWALMLTFHHSVVDEWSVRILLDELSRSYAAHLYGRQAGVPKPEFQYTDYAASQRDMAKQGAYAEQLDYWLRRLADAPTLLELPTDRPRPVAPSFRGGTEKFRVPSDIAVRLRNIARSEGATLFMVLTAAYQVLLARWTGQEDICIGTSLAGRTSSELEGLVGLFVNTVVLRADLSGNPTFSELLRSTRNAAVEAYDNQGVPFDQVVECLNPKRSLSYNPLFQVSCQMISGGDAVLDWPGLQAKVLQRPTGTAKFDLSFSAMECPDGALLCGFEYAADLFNRPTIESLARRFGHLLRQVACHPGQRVGMAEILLPEERHRVLHEWNDTVRFVPGRTLPELFEQQVSLAPDKVAVAHRNGELTYAQLNQHANRLARHLIGLGVGPGKVIAVGVDQSPTQVIALIAVLKTGAAYVPVDTGYPPGRIAYMLTDAQAACVLTTTAQARGLSGPVPAVPLDEPRLREVIARYADCDLTDAERRATLSGTLPAYIIYTSGSTGRPKGVVVEHRNLVNYLSWCLAEYPYLADRALVLTSISADLTVTGLYGPLLCGGRVYLSALDEPRPFAERTGLSFLKVTPSHLPLLADFLPHCAPAGQIVLGGETVREADVRMWNISNPGFTVVNEYGPTEVTVGCVSYSIRPGGREPDGAVPIGRPTWNTRAYVLDKKLRPVPAGARGELYLAGAQVARGYLNRPGLTAARFVPCPYGQPGERMYRTGDLVRWNASGELEFLGRQDDQVKVRGFRVELGEIESLLLDRDEVAQAAVAVHEDHLGDQRLVGYVVPAPEYCAAAKPQPAELRAFLAARLPSFMIPSALVVLDQLPLMPNGKVDRGKLPKPDFSAAVGSGEPLSPLESALCGLIADTVGLAKVGVNDNFFDIGMHSLLAVVLVSRIRTELSVNLKVRSLFDNPTVAMLANAMTSHPGSKRSPRPYLEADIALDLPTGGDRGPLPSPSASSDPGRVLVTGATGFLGAFLLRELLDRTNARAYCVVRAVSPEHAAQRIGQAMEDYRLWDPSLRARIVALPGDLEKPSLGLRDEWFNELAEQAEVIYHIGAQVNHVLPYRQLRAANVLATRETLRLAASKRIKPVHYVSTAAAALSPDNNPEVVPENRQLETGQVIATGYIESKWVSERLVQLAAEQGIPASIYRPSRIVGHTGTGACGISDALWIFVKAALAIGAAPSDHTAWPLREEDMVPVDYVTRAVVSLSRQPERASLAYHLTNSAPTATAGIFERLRHAGHKLEALEYQDWRQRLGAAAGSADRDEPAVAAAMLLLGETPRDSHPVRFDQSNTQQGLAGTGISCPVIDGTLIDKYIRYLSESGFFPPPP